MKTLRLKIEGAVLTGRSRGAEVARKLLSENSLRGESVAFDFSGVQSVTVSFISELLYVFQESGVDLRTVSIIGADEEHQKKFIELRDRLCKMDAA